MAFFYILLPIYFTMKKLQWFGILGVFILVMACSQNKAKSPLKIKLLKLKEANIYDADLVSDMVFDAEELSIDSIKQKSRIEFLKGIDLYKNKKTLYAAVRAFKNSILIFPESKTYYEMANALLDMQTKASIEESIKAYELAERIQFQPTSVLHYKLACANNLLNKFEPNKNVVNSVIGELSQAFMNGFNDTILLKNDARLKGITNTPQYHEMLVNIKARQSAGGGNALFEVFKNAFPVQNNKLVIDKENIEMESYNQSISYDFAKFIPEMQNTSFGRDVSHDYFYVAKVKETENYTALVYASVSFWGQSMQPVTTTLAVYNNQSGQIISRKSIACQCSAEKIRSSIVSNGEIVMEDFKRIWDKPITEVSFEENTVKEYVPVSKGVYAINEQGQIVAKSVSDGFVDSLSVVASK